MLCDTRQEQRLPRVLFLTRRPRYAIISPLMNATVRRDLVILALYFLLAIVLTVPLIFNFTTHQPGHGVDDPALTWAMWWMRYALFDLGANPLSSNYVFYPLGINLGAYTPTFLNGIVSIPFQFAFNVVVAQNLIVYLSLVAGGYGTLLLVREIFARLKIPRTMQTDFAAALAGAYYAFGAWHVNYVWGANFFLLSNEWIPFCVLYLLRFDKRSWRAGMLAGLFVAFQAWTEMTFALFLAMFAALYLPYLFFTQRARWRFIFSNSIALGIVALIGASPLILNLLIDTLRHGYYLASGVGRVQIFSAEPISFLIPSARHPLLGAFTKTITEANTHYAFIGYAILLLSFLGVWSWRKSRDVKFWFALAILFVLIMFGSTLYIGGQSTGIPMPFAILRQIPFVNANRYPVRFNVMLMLALALLSALGAHRLLQTRRSPILFGALMPLLIFEQLVFPIPMSDMRVPPVFQTLRTTPGDFAILEIPLGWRGSIVMQGKQDDRAQFFQTVHHKRLLGGITSRFPDFALQYFLEAPVINTLIALETERHVDDVRLAQDRAVARDVLRFFNIRYVDVNRALANEAVMNYLRDTFPLAEFYRDDERIVYRVEQLPPLHVLNADDETARLYFDDRWGRVQFTDGVAYRWSARAEAQLWLPLEKYDQSIVFQMRGAHDGQSVSIRANGQAIATFTLTTEWRTYTMNLPASIARDGLNAIIFATTTAPIGASRLDDYAIGDTGVVSPVDIVATGAGFEAGRFGALWVAGKNMISNRRGYHLVAVNSNRVESFDTFANPVESNRLAQFIAALPPGEIVAGVAIDDVSQNLSAAAVAALQSIGVENDLRFQFRAGHAFIGVKGAQPGQAVEKIDGRFPANVSVGKNVASERAGLALGRIVIAR